MVSVVVDNVVAGVSRQRRSRQAIPLKPEDIGPHSATPPGGGKRFVPFPQGTV